LFSLIFITNFKAGKLIEYFHGLEIRNLADFATPFWLPDRNIKLLL